MKLTVVDAPGRPGVDVVLAAAADAVLGDLADALGTRRESFRVERTGAAVGRATPLGALLSGDTITGASGPAPARQRLTASLVVTHGSRPGRRIDVLQGAHVLGSGRGSHLDVGDPALDERTRARLVLGPDGCRMEPLADATEAVFVDGAPLTGPRPIADGSTVQLGTTQLVFESGGRAGFAEQPVAVRSIQPAPDRAPRVVAIPAPPADAPRVRLPIATAVVPVIAVVVMLLLGVRGASLVVVGLLAPLVAVTSAVVDVIGGRSRSRRSAREWRRKLEEAAEGLVGAAEQEVGSRDAARPGLERLEQAIAIDPATVWRRTPVRGGPLVLRIGREESPAPIEVRIAPGGSAALRDEAERRTTAALPMGAAPALIALPAAGALVVSGRSETVDDAARALVLTAAAEYGPAHLHLAVLVGPSRADDWTWSAWLPHMDWQGAGRPAAFAVGAASSTRLLDALAERFGHGRGDAGVEHAVVVLDPTVDVSRGVWERLRDAAGGRVHVVSLGAPRMAVELTIEVGDDGDDRILEQDRALRVERRSAAEALRTARLLSPVLDPESEESNALPDSVGLLRALRLPAPTGRALLRRWSDADPLPLVAVIGEGEDGPVRIDLAGRHLIVGGTTGAGKSELLQTLICALAVEYSPERVNFLFVDYKGGSAFRAFEGLPHTAGSVSDLDPVLVQRTLTSIRAELLRRERILAQHDVRSIDELIGRAPALAPPRLLVVVDEFATLAKEVPDFVPSAVRLAQQGRSLGMSLVLATQRPAGVVTAELAGVMNLRVSLRVNNEQDSRDLVGVLDAARIPPGRPGRAVVSLEAPTRLVQSAYSSGPVAARRLPVRALRSSDPQLAAVAPDRGSSGTEQEAVVAAAVAAAVSGRVGPPFRPWLPPLPTAVDASRLVDDAPAGTGRIPVGIVDLPARQVQPVAAVDLDGGGLLVLGGPRSGRSTALRTVVAALAERSDADELRVLVIDAAGGSMSALAALPQVGGIVRGEEVDRVQDLLEHLSDLVLQRSRRSGQHGRHRRTVLVVDGLSHLMPVVERSATMSGQLQRVLSVGPGLGVHAVIATERPTPAQTAVVALLPQRLVLRLVSDTDYAGLGIPAPPRDAPRIPGRGLLNGDEIQVGVRGGGASGGEDAALAALGADLRRRSSAVASPPPSLPDELPRSGLPAGDPGTAVIGLQARTLRPVGLRVGAGHALVTGPARSGRTTTLVGIAEAVLLSTPRAAVHLIAGSGAWRSALPPELAERLVADAVVLLEAIAQGPSERPLDAPVVLLIDDAEALIDRAAVAVLERLAAMPSTGGVWIVAAADAGSIGRTRQAWLTAVRSNRHGIVLEPTSMSADLLGIPARSVPGVDRRSPKGRALIAVDDEDAVVQLARPTTAQPGSR